MRDCKYCLKTFKSTSKVSHPTCDKCLDVNIQLGRKKAELTRLKIKCNKLEKEIKNYK